MRNCIALLVLLLTALAVPYASYANSESGSLTAFSKEGSYRQEKLAESTDCFDMSLSYPEFGIPALDQSVRAWAEQFFAWEVAEFKRECPKSGGAAGQIWEFQGDVANVFSTQGTLSIEFGFYSYSGGAHPSHFTRTLILNAEGKQLGYEDLLGTMDGLWAFLAEFSFNALRPGMEKNDCWNSSTVQDGLAKYAESFQYFVVTPKGLTLIFPEYQIAPYVCGAFSCDVPLQALAQFSPKPGIWDSAPPSENTTSSLPVGAFSPSFDCAKASNTVERAICADPVLSQLDVSMAEDYRKALDMTADKQALVAEQRQWLRQMHAQCAEKAVSACIQAQYEKRIRQLKAH